MRLVLRFAERSLIGFGILALAWAAWTFAYGEIFQRLQIREFDRKLDARELSNGADPSTELESAEAGLRAPAVALRRGDLVGRLEIPRLGMSVMVLHGVESETLRVAAGHVPGTPLPGGEGNSAIAAHRDTFFRKLEGIRPGDVIRFATPNRTYAYAVEWTEVVGPQETRVLESHQPGSELTLITCYPFYFVGAAPERFVVRARYVSGWISGESNDSV